jgi:hypothetical protein
MKPRVITTRDLDQAMANMARLRQELESAGKRAGEYGDEVIEIALHQGEAAALSAGEKQLTAFHERYLELTRQYLAEIENLCGMKPGLLEPFEGFIERFNALGVNGMLDLMRKNGRLLQAVHV